MKKRLLVFNSGSGSGAQELVENARSGILQAEIVGFVVSSEKCKCIERAKNLGIPYIIMTSYEAEDYQKIMKEFRPDFIALSGWLKLVVGLDPQTTFNIHPGPLPKYGGKGKWGEHVHKAVIHDATFEGLEKSEVTMHFVNGVYDDGPVFFRYPIWIRDNDTADTLGARVNKIEHAWQSYVTNLVITGQIHWDGVDKESLVVPKHMEQFLIGS